MSSAEAMLSLLLQKRVHVFFIHCSFGITHSGLLVIGKVNKAENAPTEPYPTLDQYSGFRNDLLSEFRRFSVPPQSYCHLLTMDSSCVTPLMIGHCFD